VGGIGTLAACAIAAALVIGAAPRSSEVVVAAFATDLSRRTPSQRHNAVVAARALDGAVVAPGAVFSFNRRVRNWTSDAGYRKAPVSYEGRLVTAVGGGVCQVSSTLYNAALLAGSPIVERHRHAVAPSYVPPGRDAAVAFETLDLRFRNGLRSPIRIAARTDRSSVTVSLLSADRPTAQVSVLTRVLARNEPERLVVAEDAPGEGLGRAQPAGSPGWRVVTYRCTVADGRETHRERVSDDTYRTVHRVWFAGP